MGQQKTDVIFLGKGQLNDNSQAAAFFSSNSVVEIWSAGPTYSQYNVVEYSGSVYRSKVNSNTGNQPDVSPGQFEVLYRGVKNGDFCFVLGAGATILQRQGGLWLVFGNHPAKIQNYDEPMIVVSGAPANDNEVSGPVLAGTILTLPLDSRDSNSTEQYVVGSGDLEVRLNGNRLLVGDDWSEVGAPNANSTLVQVNIQLEIGDQITFRRESVVNLTGYGGGGGGGGGGSLQDAYNVSNTINTTLGVPFTVTGTGTVVTINGNLLLNGVLI